MDVDHLPAAIRHYREKAGLSQRALAKAVGMHYVTLNRLEQHGEHDIRLSTLRAIAEAVGVTTAELLAWPKKGGRK